MKKLLPLILLAASCGSQTNDTNRVNIPKPAEIDATNASQMPGKTKPVQPFRFQSAQPQQIQPTFADGVRLGFMVARRNQDLNDLQAVYAYAVQFWQQEAAQRQAQAQQQGQKP